LLYWLLYLKLFHYFPPFRIFRYLTFRTAFASLTALFTALILGPIIIRRLREFQIGQYIREEGPQAHQKKAGTPTMGGLLIAISIVVPTLLWADLSNPFVWIVVFSTIAFAAIGFADDYQKVVHRRNLGLTARAKLGLQVAASALIAIVLIALQYRGMYSTRLVVPFFKQFHPDLVLLTFSDNDVMNNSSTLQPKSYGIHAWYSPYYNLNANGQLVFQPVRRRPFNRLRRRIRLPA